MKRLLLVLLAACFIAGGAAVGHALFKRYEKQARLRALHADLPAPLDQTILDAGSLWDPRGKPRLLANFRDARAIVLIFLGIECPVSNLSLASVLDLEERFRGKEVQFVAVFPNETETANLVAGYALEREIPFLVCRDIGATLAKAMGIQRTPTACVLDRHMILRYRGRVDDELGIAPRPVGSDRANLRNALEEVLANVWVTVATTEVDGRPIEIESRSKTTEPVTYAKDVAPLLGKHCQSCHRTGGSAPFSLLTYEEVVRRSARLAVVVAERYMPPWHADPRYGVFANRRELNDAEVNTLVAWVEQGMPRGNPAEEPKAIEWPGRWSIGVPDVVIEVPKPFQVESKGSESIRYASVDATTTNLVFAEDRWIQAAEVLPTDASVVRRIAVFILPPGPATLSPNLESASGVLEWLPGGPTYLFPEGSALRVPRYSQLVFEVHYVPNGAPSEDRPAVGLLFSKERPTRELVILTQALASLSIDPRDPHFRGDLEYVFPRPHRLLGLMAKMNLRGKAYGFELVFPDGKRRTVLSVPRFDYFQQEIYWLEDPIDVPAGTRLITTGWWDNSRSHWTNPDPDTSVKRGRATVEERLEYSAFLDMNEP